MQAASRSGCSDGHLPLDQTGLMQPLDAPQAGGGDTSPVRSQLLVALGGIVLQQPAVAGRSKSFHIKRINFHIFHIQDL
jgi:hypothetical protein